MKANKRQAIGAAAVVMPLGAFVPASPAAASGACVSPANTNYLPGGGGDINATTVGAAARIEFSPSVLCYPPDSPLTRGTAVWAGVFGWGSDGWAQAGYLQVDNQTAPHFFSQYSACGACTPTSVVKPNGPSVSHNYKVVYKSTVPRSASMYYDSNLLDTTTFDPKATFASPFQAQYVAETLEASRNSVVGVLG